MFVLLSFNNKDYPNLIVGLYAVLRLDIAHYIIGTLGMCGKLREGQTSSLSHFLNVIFNKQVCVTRDAISKFIHGEVEIQRPF